MRGCMKAFGAFGAPPTRGGCVDGEKLLLLEHQGHLGSLGWVDPAAAHAGRWNFCIDSWCFFSRWGSHCAGFKREASMKSWAQQSFARSPG